MARTRKIIRVFAPVPKIVKQMVQDKKDAMDGRIEAAKKALSLMSVSAPSPKS
jgi:uncharacterized protein YybS (DUF2232 family)